MSKSREDLHQLLQNFQTALPALIEQHPDDADFLEAFLRQAGTIAEHAAPADCAWVNAQLIRLFAGRANVGESGEPSRTSSSPPADPDDGEEPVAE